jgi:Flp pilus assembly protein TadG
MSGAILGAFNRAAARVRAACRRCGRFAHDESGVSAVEFAMVMPLMVPLYLGTVELSQGLDADRKVTITARTVADLVARVSSINNAEMINTLNASAAVIAPFSVSKLKVTVSSVTIDGQGKATIAWSDTLNGTPRSKGTTVSLPDALKIANTSLIWSEVQYSYKPAIGYLISGTLILKDESYMRPRLSDQVTRAAT